MNSVNCYRCCWLLLSSYAWFVAMLEEDIIEITNIPQKKMVFGKKEKEQFDKETKCWICNGKFVDDVENYKVRDHCHFTGRFRGAAHKKCKFIV